MELIILIRLIVFSNLVTSLVHCYDFNRIFNAPLTEIRYVPRKVTAVCGQRFYRLPINIEYNKECFKKSYKSKYIIQTFDNQTDKSKPQLRIPIIDQNNPFIDHNLNEAPNEAPWSVRLVREYTVHSEDGKISTKRMQTVCTGVLISLKHIMTAKSCFTNDSERFKIFLNPPSGYDKDYYNDDTGMHNRVTKHPKQDLAIVELYYAIDPQAIGNRNNNTHVLVNPICLPYPNRPKVKFDTRYKPATYYGWGQIGPYREANLLQKADIEVTYDHSTDKKSYHFVQRGTDAKFPCLGDGGSGLVQYVDKERSRAVLIGILKEANNLPKGYDCNLVVIDPWPILFTRVDKNMDWILQALRLTRDT